MGLTLTYERKPSWGGEVLARRVRSLALPVRHLGGRQRPLSFGAAPQRSHPPPAQPSPVDEARLHDVAAACRDERICAEIQACASSPPRLAALLEDALAHDAWAWPPSHHGRTVRPDATPQHTARASEIRITLPLPETEYRGVRFADTWYTRPQ